MVLPTIDAKRGQTNFRSIVPQTRIGKARGAEEEPVLATASDRGPAILVRERPTVPQVKIGKDGCSLIGTDKRNSCPVDCCGLPAAGARRRIGHKVEFRFVH